MSEQTFENSFVRETSCISNLFEEYVSININQICPVAQEQDSNFPDTHIFFTEEQPKKKQTKTKRRMPKFERQGNTEIGKQKRDVKKYARFDIINEIYEKFQSKSGEFFQRTLQIVKEQKICKRSLRYFFVIIGVMRLKGSLEKFIDFFKQKKQSTIGEKYHWRTQSFKSILEESLNYSIRAMQLANLGYFKEAIQVAYTENQHGVRGRTKNPIQMEKCQRLYVQTFLPLITDPMVWI